MNKRCNYGNDTALIGNGSGCVAAFGEAQRVTNKD